MHAFALVAAKPGRQVPPAALDAIEERSPAELAFDAEAHVRWSDDGGRLAFGGWQVDARALGMGSHWEVRPGGLTAFTGHPWWRGTPWTAGATWAAQLADRFEGTPLVESHDEIDGVFSAVSLHADGRGCVASDPLGFNALFRAESDDVFVVSSRAALAARLVTPLGGRAPRDLEGVVSLAYCAYVIGDRTGYEQVRTLPPGSSVVLHPTRAAEVRTSPDPPWLPTGEGPVDDLPELVDGLRRELAASVRACAQVPGTRIANLTGGRDSRLVLALLVAEGLADRFTYNTFGSPELPDCVVATAIADRFGLDHRASTRREPGSRARPPAGPGGTGLPPAAGGAPATTAAAYERQLRHHVWLTSGLLSTWDMRDTPPIRSPDLVLTGLFGEALRTTHPGLAGMTTLDEAIGHVSGTRLGLDAGGLLTVDARRHFDTLTAQDLATKHRPGRPPLDALDGVYLAGRLRRWFGPQPDADARNRVFPLYSLRAIRAAFALGPLARRADVLPFELMRACCPELAAMPFATSAWAEAAIAHLPDAERYRTPSLTSTRQADRRPDALRSVAPRGPATATVNQEDQARSLDVRVPVLRAQLDLPADHRLFDLLDRSAVLRAVDRFPELDHKSRRAVHSAVTAAMWLNGSERRRRDDDSVGTPGA